MSIDAMRRDYGDQPLLETEVRRDPIEQFGVWFEQACDGSIYEPNAMSLATVGGDGVPSVRVVLLKGVDGGGFRFFTNLESDKGRAIAARPEVGLCFHWDHQHRQVRVQGVAEELSRDDVEAYFHSRPRESQLGAWASRQSSVVADRAMLESEYAVAEKRYAVGRVPVPDFWGGYLVRPRSVEFWQGRKGRLHDRLRYRLDGAAWVIERLSP